MRNLVVAAALLVVPMVAVQAQTYRCPQTYPGKAAPAPLTGAFMDAGEERGGGTYAPPMDEAAQDGYNIPYSFADDEQAWLVCSYGGKKRIKGRVHDGREWNQHMEGGSATWWVKLAPKVGRCNVQIREIKAAPPKPSSWTATAVCTPLG